MAAIDITNGGLQAGPDAADNHINFVGPFNPNANRLYEVLIQVISITGTGIKFAVCNGDEAIPADAYSAPVGYKQVLTVNPVTQKLRFQCSNAADSFQISV